MTEFNLLNLPELAVRLAKQLSSSEGQVATCQVQAALDLLEEGNTLPFIARYRKEATQGLDEQQLRTIEDGLTLAKELADRKKTILKMPELIGQGAQLGVDQVQKNIGELTKMIESERERLKKSQSKFLRNHALKRTMIY